MLLFGQFYAVVAGSYQVGVRRKGGVESSHIVLFHLLKWSRGTFGVLGTVSPRGISSISRFSPVESLDETSTISGSGCGVKGQGRGLTCSGLVLGKGLGACQLVHISRWWWKYSDHEE